MASPAEEQIVENYSTLGEYLTELKNYLNDPDTKVAPVFGDFVSELKYEDILTLVRSRIMDNPGFSIARAQDEINKVEALYRESLIRDFSKRDYYDNAESGIDREIEYLTAEKTRTVKYLQGKMSIQGGD